MERERDLCLESRFLGSTLLLDSSETLIKSSKLSSLGFLIWKMKGLDRTSGEGLCCETLLYLLGIGNSWRFMTAMSIQKHHVNLS